MRVIATGAERWASRVRRRDGGGGRNGGRCNQKATAEGSRGKKGARGFAERGKGGGSGNGRHGDGRFAEHSRRRGCSGNGGNGK